MQQGSGTHRRADAVHPFTGEPVVEQSQQVVGENLPAVVLGHRAPGRTAVSASVVPEEPGPAEPTSEVEIHQAVAMAAGRESVELHDRVATLVAQLHVQFGSRNTEGRHGGSWWVSALRSVLAEEGA